MTLVELVNNDIKEAMKARDKVKLETLRNIKKVFLEAMTAPGANDKLDDAEALKIIQKLAKQGKEAAEMFTKQNRNDLADAELAQVKVIETYLPKQLPQEEVEKIVKEIISKTCAQGMKDMGKVMGAANQALAGQTDGKTLSTIVKKLLA